MVYLNLKYFSAELIWTAYIYETYFLAEAVLSEPLTALLRIKPKLFIVLRGTLKETFED